MNGREGMLGADEPDSLSFFQGDEQTTQIIRHSQAILEVEDEQVPGESDEDEPEKIVEVTSKPRRRRKRDHRRIVVNTFGTKYAVVVQARVH